MNTLQKQLENLEAEFNSLDPSDPEALVIWEQAETLMMEISKSEGV